MIVIKKKKMVILLLCLTMVFSLFAEAVPAFADWGDGTWGVPGEVNSGSLSSESSWGMPSNNRFSGTFKWDEPAEVSPSPAPSKAPQESKTEETDKNDAQAEDEEEVAEETASEVPVQEEINEENLPVGTFHEDKTDGIKPQTLMANTPLLWEFPVKFRVAPPEYSTNTMIAFNYAGRQIELKPGAQVGEANVYAAQMDANGNYEIALLQVGENAFNFTYCNDDDATFDVMLVGGGGAGGPGGYAGANASSVKNGYGGDGGNTTLDSGLLVSDYMSSVTATVGAGGSTAGTSWTYALCNPSSCGCRRGDTGNGPFLDTNKTCRCPHDSRDAERYGGDGTASVFGGYMANGGKGGRGGSAGRDPAYAGENGVNSGTYTIFGVNYSCGIGGQPGYITHEPTTSGYSWTSWPWGPDGFDPQRYHAAVFTGHAGDTAVGYGNGGGGNGTDSDYTGCTTAWNSSSGVTEHSSSSGAPGQPGIIYITGTLPLKGIIEIYKTATPPEYGFDGFEFQLVKVEGSSETIIGTVVTNETGYARFVNLDPGEYIVRELPRDGWIIDDEQSCLLVEGGTMTVALSFTNVSLSRIQVQKTTDDFPVRTDLSGFQFDVYKLEGTNEIYVETITTGPDGIATSSWFTMGDDYVVYEKANEEMEKYHPNNTRMPINLEFRENFISFSNVAYKLNASIRKVDSALGNEAQGSGTLEGATYALLCYDLIEGNLVENIICYADSDANGNIAFPVQVSAGLQYYIKEVVAPTGYQLNETPIPLSMEFDTVNEIYTSGQDVADDIIMAPIFVDKKDADANAQLTVFNDPAGFTYGSDSQGDTDINSGVFSIYYDESNINDHIVVNGTVYNKGDLITTVTANSWSIPLPYGTYSVVETEPPDGYQPDDTTTVYVNNYDPVPVATFYNNVELAPFFFHKHSTDGTRPDKCGLQITNMSDHDISIHRDYVDADNYSFLSGYTNHPAGGGWWVWHPGGVMRLWLKAQGDELYASIMLPPGRYSVLEDQYPTNNFVVVPAAERVTYGPVANYYNGDVNDMYEPDLHMWNERSAPTDNAGWIRLRKEADANIPADAMDDEFTVRVTCSASKAVEWYINGALQGTKNPNGTYTIHVGDTLEFVGVPVKSYNQHYSPNQGQFYSWDDNTFTITETAVPEGWTQVTASSQNLSGKVYHYFPDMPYGRLDDADTAETLETWERTDPTGVLVNHYEYSLPDTVSMTISKSVSGIFSDTSERFPFRIVLVNDADDTPYTGTVTPSGSAVPYAEWSGSNGVYTFTLAHGESISFDIPEGVSYVVTETDSAGYETTVNSAPGTEASGVASLVSGDISCSFANSKEGASIIVNKTLAGISANMSDFFEFTMSLFEADGVTPYTGDVRLEGDGSGFSTVEDGVYTFTLGHGDSLTITLPDGVRYVVEEDPNGYTCTVNNSPVDSVSGVINHVDGDAEYAFKNTKNGGGLTVSKTIEGNAADLSKTFRFTAIFYKRAGSNETYTGTVTPVGDVHDWEGSDGIYSFSLGNGESISFELPGGVIYMVEEDPDGYIPSVNGDPGLRRRGPIEDGVDQTLVFTNTKNTAEIIVSKSVEGSLANPDDVFTFTAEFTLNSVPYDGAITASGDVTDWENVESGVYTFKLGNSESITMTVPAGVSYVISENAQGYLCSVNNTSATTAEGTVVAGVNRTFAFKNTKNGSGLTVSKRLSGNFRNLNDTFNFTLTLKDGQNNPYTDTIMPEGDVHDWSSTAPGVYVFKLGHEEALTLSLPSGVSYSITEQPRDYKAAVDGSAGTSVSGQITAASGNISHEFVNTKNGTVPTGVSASWGIGLFVAVIALAGAAGSYLAVLHKKKKV